MQVSKNYNGSIASVGSSSARQVSYGVSNTVTCYQNRVDFVNQTIADFLAGECGVDAAYEVRAGSDAKFLWIFDVPFLFGNSSATTYHFSFYGPLSSTYLNPGSSGIGSGTGILASIMGYSLFLPASATGTAYNFTLYFDGDPNKGFVLRIKIGTSSISNGFFFAFLKATNIISGKNAVVWKYGNGSNVANTYGFWVNGIDLNADGTIDQGSFSPTSYTTASSSPGPYYMPNLHTSGADKANNPGKLPLVPVLFGAWKAENVYQRPMNFDLSQATTTATETQTVIEISGRKFLITCSDTSNSTYIDLGLIEVTD